MSIERHPSFPYNTPNGWVKRCSKCRKHLPVANFTKASKTKVGFVSACKECDGAYLLQLARAYNKTRFGLLVRAYRNMLSRVRGIQWKKAHLYQGLPILNREDFYLWSLRSTEYEHLFIAWEASNFDRSLTPSVNRIDSAKGYTLDNMEWITHGENSAATKRNRLKRAS